VVRWQSGATDKHRGDQITGGAAAQPASFRWRVASPELTEPHRLHFDIVRLHEKLLSRCCGRVLLRVRSRRCWTSLL
jgi:hypothetical protein